MSEDPIKDTLQIIPYGFYAVTSKNGNEVNAMVANWITQVSFDPRLVALGLQKTAYTRSVIEQGRVFTINLFRKEDRESIMPYTKSREKNPDKMSDARYTLAPETGCPVLEGAAAYIEFRVTNIFDSGGGHDIVVGEAVGAAVLKPAEPSEILTLPDLGWSYAG